LLSPEEKHEIDGEIAIVPRRSAACIEALRAVQRHRGWVDDRALADVAAYLDMSIAELDSVATFYNLIFRRPVGRHVIHFCDSVSCWVVGSPSLREALSTKLAIRYGETTADGRFTLLPIQCLGACDRAPVLMIDQDTHFDVTAESLGDILGRYP
jgi:NADH-quinone oxidoreductase subunit E